MRRTLRGTLALALAGAFTVTGLATTAHAVPPGVKVASYGWPDQCSYNGNLGVANHSWTSYTCDVVTPVFYVPGSGGPYPGQYDLYVVH